MMIRLCWLSTLVLIPLLNKEVVVVHAFVFNHHHHHHHHHCDSSRIQTDQARIISSTSIALLGVGCSRESIAVHRRSTSGNIRHFYPQYWSSLTTTTTTSSSTTTTSTSLKYYGPSHNNKYNDNQNNANDDEGELVPPLTSLSSSSSESSSDDSSLPLSSSDDAHAQSAIDLNNDYYYLYDDQDAGTLCDWEDVDCHAFLLRPQTRSSSYSSLQVNSYSNMNNIAILLAAELRERVESFQQERIEYNWRVAHCPTTLVPISTSDGVRRVDMENYPIAACGGSQGGVYVVNLETKHVLAKVGGVHPSSTHSQVVVDKEEVQWNGNNNNNNNSGKSSKSKHRATMTNDAMEKMYGKLDGGGVISVAIRGEYIASSGREGGVQLWKIDQAVVRDDGVTSTPSAANTNGGSSFNTDADADARTDATTNQLTSLGTIQELDHTIVTCLKFDSNDRLWVACFDGTIRAYNITAKYHENASKGKGALVRPWISLFQSDFTDSVLDIHLCEELQLGICATADGTAALFRMCDGQFLAGILLSEVPLRSVLILKHNQQHSMEYSALCGTADGIIHALPLNVLIHAKRNNSSHLIINDNNTPDICIDEEHPFRVSEATNTAIQPRHVGPVMCMASPSDGQFVSGGQDGTLRVWTTVVNKSNNDVADDRFIGTKEDDIQWKCRYALTGYKLWLGSVCTDGKRLISDGGENSIIVRDFSSERRTNGKASL